MFLDYKELCLKLYFYNDLETDITEIKSDDINFTITLS